MNFKLIFLIQISKMNKIDFIKESLTCGLCLSLLNKPIILPCLTTICENHVLESK
jgi:hypothetical protein